MIIRLDEDFFDFAEYDETINQTNDVHFKTKYISPLINLANTFAGATRPKSMGFSLNEYMAQYSETVPEDKRTLESWTTFVNKTNPECQKEVTKATEKLYTMLKNFEEVLKQTNKKIVEDWISDLLYMKTFNGFQLQNTIIKSVAGKLGYKYTFGTKEDESKGIDGYIGERAVNVKPDTHKSKVLTEKIDAKMIYYTKLRDGSYDIEFDINPRILLVNNKKVVLKYFKGDVKDIQTALKIFNDGYNAVEGDFILMGQDITSIKNKIPLYITGDLNLSKTHLKSVEGYSPISILGNMDLSYNNLIDLKGIIGEYIGKNFIISNNPIKTFAYVPEIVGKDFHAEKLSVKASEENIETLIRGKLIDGTIK